jgi:hypothetical protein
VCLFVFPRSALAWGDEGHEIIALVADRFLGPAVREKIVAMIAADPDNLTARDIASEAAWADRYRDSDRNGSRRHYAQTRALRWRGRRIVPGFFDGEHSFQIRTHGRSCRFHQSERFTGIMVKVIGDGLFDAVQQGFEEMNAALKLRVEAVSRAS